MVSGCMPFQGEDTDATLGMIKAEEPYYPNYLSADVRVSIYNYEDTVDPNRLKPSQTIGANHTLVHWCLTGFVELFLGAFKVVARLPRVEVARVDCFFFSVSLNLLRSSDSVPPSRLVHPINP